MANLRIQVDVLELCCDAKGRGCLQLELSRWDTN